MFIVRVNSLNLILLHITLTWLLFPSQRRVDSDFGERERERERETLLPPLHTLQHNTTMTRNREEIGKIKVSLQPEPEDWCFESKNGRQLVVCDHRNCGKVYHPECVEKDESFFDNVESWFCGRHVCFNCKKHPKFCCIGCPKAVCKKCFYASEFTIVRGVKVLYVECLEIVKIIEQNLEHDSKGNKISLDDNETYEALFKEYWQDIKEKEGLTSDDISVALPNHRKGKNYVLHTSCSESEDDSKSNSNEDYRDNKRRPTKQKKYNSMSKDKIYDRLESQFAKGIHDSTLDKHDSSDKHIDDQNKNDSTDKHIEDQTCIESKLSGIMEKPLIKKGDLLVKPTCFASINVSNIKLIYLKQSLVQELSKKRPESFVSKVVGTFVRAKVVDSNDHKQRKSYQLVRVLGVVNDEISHEILLQVSSTPEAIPIFELSDVDFKEGEVQEKAASLHEDITEHWIASRIAYLQFMIERANLARRMKEKFAKLEEKEELEKPEKLLSRVPSVFPEFMEAKYDDFAEDKSETSRYTGPSMILLPVLS